MVWAKEKKVREMRGEEGREGRDHTPGELAIDGQKLRVKRGEAELR
jgi:hypothetical protein